jgi:hypothetical protein
MCCFFFVLLSLEALTWLTLCHPSVAMTTHDTVSRHTQTRFRIPVSQLTSPPPLRLVGTPV